MKITVDIEEFWIDSASGKITDELRDYVSHMVIILEMLINKVRRKK